MGTTGEHCFGPLLGIIDEVHCRGPLLGHITGVLCWDSFLGTLLWYSVGVYRNPLLGCGGRWVEVCMEQNPKSLLEVGGPTRLLAL